MDVWSTGPPNLPHSNAMLRSQQLWLLVRSLECTLQRPRRALLVRVKCMHWWCCAFTIATLRTATTTAQSLAATTTAHALAAATAMHSPSTAQPLTTSAVG